MDALTPAAPSTGPAAPTTVPRRAPERVVAREPAAARGPHAGQPQTLPALPAAVQRTTLDAAPVPPARLMTREEMAALLSLTT